MNRQSQQGRVTEYFNADPAAYAQEYQTESAAGHSFRSRKHSLLKMLGRGTGRVLDIGCGPGVMTGQIVELGWEYYGVDLSAAMIETARAKFAGQPKINFTVSAAEKLNFPDHYFDVVIAMGLVEYLDDEAAALHELRRALKPNGCLIVSIPNWWSPARMWDRWLLSPLAKTIRRCLGRRPSAKIIHREYRLSAYRRWLQKQGFQTIAWQATNYRLLPRPFDFWFPHLAVSTARWLEKYLSFFWFLGTSINVKVIRIRNNL